MTRFPRTLAGLAAVALLVTVALLAPAAGPYLLLVTVAGTSAAMVHEHAHR